MFTELRWWTAVQDHELIISFRIDKANESALHPSIKEVTPKSILLNLANVTLLLPASRRDTHESIKAPSLHQFPRLEIFLQKPRNRNDLFQRGNS
jgi:hypothetical protein